MKKVLLTGVTGYIGKRLLPLLQEDGYEVICTVRDKNRFPYEEVDDEKVTIIEVDFLDKKSLEQIPQDIDVAFYLIHSMSATSGDFESLEIQSAENFRDYINTTSCEQVIYLSGIVNEKHLSKHLISRKHVEEVLNQGTFHLTTLRAGIIIGSGSASFEIIRDLVEKLPVMVTPRWLKTKSQPIAIRDMLTVLQKCILCEKVYDGSFDVGMNEVLTYEDMLQQYAEVRGLKRYILILPVMTPKLSSYWLYFVTSTSYNLAVNLVESMKVEVVCNPDQLNLLDYFGIKPLTYKEAIQLAFDRIEQQHIISSWKDSLVSGLFNENISNYVQVPTFGCFVDKRKMEIDNSDRVVKNIWKIGGKHGWYYGNWLWKIRGFMDKMVGGIGLRRGRTNPTELHAGDTLDFWRVIYANKEERRLLLFAEMKVPGEAWLEFKVCDQNILHQTATFRPKGISGRLYWYSVLPFHGFIFKGMLEKIGTS
ncbi:SDR family oxidoreductase [Aureivirga sp. CE67]|uniref:SDR family oxidoreductase n=1 Tax=Aureivirga sp. CE67 TaxID=1788983 RepID=UPI0018C9E024|nr:SDR family oxidoreductase [Aureivirga sp. CE67]